MKLDIILLLIWMDLNRENSQESMLLENVKNIEEHIKNRFSDTKEVVQWDQMIHRDFMVLWTLRCVQQHIDVHTFLIYGHVDMKFVEELLERGLYLEQKAYNLLLTMVHICMKETAKRIVRNQIHRCAKKKAAYDQIVRPVDPYIALRDAKISSSKALEILQDVSSSSTLLWAQIYLDVLLEHQKWSEIAKVCATLQKT